MAIKSRIRTIPDHPKPGIQFRDITTLLLDPVGFRIAVEGLAQPFRGTKVDKVAGIEARGFILGGAVAMELGAGFVPVRKSGKLPHETIGKEYELEYGTDRIEVHSDAVGPGDRVLIVDDVLATGGTGAAAVKLVEALGADVIGFSVLVELAFLGGRARLEDTDVHAVVHYGPA